MMLGGGGTINWSFIQQGLADELSLVIAPAADGNSTTQTLFMAKDGISDEQPVVFKVKGARLMATGRCGCAMRLITSTKKCRRC